MRFSGEILKFAGISNISKIFASKDKAVITMRVLMLFSHDIP